MAASLETSGSTVKISYLRFIWDAAQGLVLILIAIVMRNRGVFTVIQGGMSKEERTLLAVVALLLAVPAGLVVSGLSHLLLGAIRTWVNRQCFRVRAWPMHDTHRSSLTAEWS